MSRSMFLALSVFAVACGAPADGSGGGDRSDGTADKSPHDADGGTQTSNPGTVPDGGKVVFVTSASYNGELGGAAGADELCNAAAQAAGLTGPFVAWLGTSGNVYSRIHDASPWYLLDGEVAFKTASQLRTQPLVALAVDENGRKLGYADAMMVWTGTSTGGNAEYTCSSWTTQDDESFGTYGDATEVSSWTTDGNYADCRAMGRLYCFEQ